MAQLADNPALNLDALAYSAGLPDRKYDPTVMRYVPVPEPEEEG